MSSTAVPTSSKNEHLSDWIMVGVIVGAFGIRGELRVRSHTDMQERFSVNSCVYINGDAKKIVSSRPHRGGLLLMLAGILDRNAAEALKGTELTVPSSELTSLTPGSYYHFQIIGMGVYALDGQNLGHVSEILSTGSNDVYVVKGQAGKEVLIPALKSVVINVDLDLRTMLVDLPKVV